MRKTKTFILIAFVLAMGAGVAVGMLGSRTIPKKLEGRSWLVDELHLTSAQEQQMNQIWGDMMRNKGRAIKDQLDLLKKERQAEIDGLLSDDQKSKVEQIDHRFGDRARELWKQCQQDFTDAADQSRKVLDESQRLKYDELVNKMQSQFADGDSFAAMVLGRLPTTRESVPVH
ncbi:MAG TPA: Spy/CpxP family protein refolding chaperone [Tepidisphaeraceae bacterium]|nr:Spy/CpxP family protein refolding chaperone [Tepidisphaeraceae bacterium]